MNTNIAKLMGIVGTQTVQITLLQERVTELEGQLKDALARVIELEPKEALTAVAK